MLSEEDADRLERIILVYELGREHGRDEMKQMMLEFANEAFNSMQSIKHNNPLSFKDVCIKLLEKY